MPQVVEFVTDCEVLETSLNKETIIHFNAQRSIGKESITLESQNSTQSTPKFKEIIMPNLGSNDSDLHAADGVIDHAIDDDNPILERLNMVTDKVLNSEFLNTNLTLNANPVETIVLKKKSNTLVTTLAASTHEHYVTTNLDHNQLTPSMVESGEWPKNIRSWKCIMRQLSPNEAAVLVETERKRKQSTCMEAILDFPCKRIQIQSDQSS